MGKCPKCQGLIIEGKIFIENEWVDDKHCLHCGERYGFNPITEEQRSRRKLKQHRKGGKG